MSKPTIRIHEHDNVAVALEPLEKGREVEISNLSGKISTKDEIPSGHKLAVNQIKKDSAIIKYGYEIGFALQDIQAGEWIHSHNLVTALSGTKEYEFDPVDPPKPERRGPDTFMGYRRSNGKVGTRNEIWILNTVGCVNKTAEILATECRKHFQDSPVDAFNYFNHPYGCSQLGDDLEYTQDILRGLITHPNAGGVVILGLGCESNQLPSLLKDIPEESLRRIKYFNAQDVGDEIDAGIEAVQELIDIIKHDDREPCPVSDLNLGMKCGGSDGLSGITANPLIGRMSNRITSFNGTSILTEVPEMFGAEQVLMNRAKDNTTFNEVVELINNFKQYFIKHNQPVYENPSPGNKQGGLTTLEEKSLGAIQKGGDAIVTGTVNYGKQVNKPGLVLLESPGNDPVSCTAEVAAGATILLFSTGRGTPMGFPSPTLKIATNTTLAEKKKRWIDFNAGQLTDENKNMDQLSDELWEQIIRTASGEMKTQNEMYDYREIAIWKQGVTL